MASPEGTMKIKRIEHIAVAVENLEQIASLLGDKFGQSDQQLQFTVNDPKAYTKPWSATRYLKIAVNTELIEDICNENNRNLPHMIGK